MERIKIKKICEDHWYVTQGSITVKVFVTWQDCIDYVFGIDYIFNNWNEELP